MIEVRRIGLEDLTKADVSAILTRCSEDEYGWQFQHVLDAIKAGVFALFRWTGDFRGLMIVRVNAYPGGKEMYIWHLHGKGFLKNIERVKALTQQLAVRHGCRWVAASSRRKGLIAAYRRMADAITVDFRMEAKNG